MPWLSVSMGRPTSAWKHLESKIDSLDWHTAREDVRRFVKTSEQPSLELWSKDLFLSQRRKIKE